MNKGNNDPVYWTHVPGYIARRYLHKPNKAAEAEMLRRRELRARQVFDPVEEWDIEALKTGLMMNGSRERETKAIREALEELEYVK